MHEASRKTIFRVVDRPLIPLNNPDPSWYSRYWLEDRPWPDLAFSIGRVVRRVARLAISAARTSGARWFHRARNIALSGEKRPAAPASPTQNAQHSA
jgi:hypothetical protein